MTTSRTIASLFAVTALVCSSGALARTSHKSNLGSCNVNGKVVSSATKDDCATAGGKWRLTRQHTAASDTSTGVRGDSMVGKTAAGGALTPSAVPGPQNTTTRDSGD